MMMNKENNNILTSPSSNYKKLSQREHVLARPDTYVGSVEFRTNEMWIYDAESKQLKSKEITYVPALYKIFDEILVNAADNKQRDPTMSWIKVDIDVENGLISVANNGKGIPVAMHSKEKMYIPELIFGNLLTSDNYDDKKNNKRTTGGRNGFGAKLTNIFSKSFTVETVDSSRNKKYVQTWNDNMLKRNDPKIKACGKGKKDYTKIIFKPDLAKFGMTSLDKDTVSLFTKRVYDMAGVTDSSVRVFLNGEKLDTKTFKDYVTLCQQSMIQKLQEEGRESSVQFLNVNDRWTVAVCASTGQFEQCSFVNSICTSKGGSHVSYITDQIATHLEKEFKKKNKKVKGIKKSQIKNFLCVFVNCLIENPSFDSQTKDTLTTPTRNFGSTAELPPKFLKALAGKKMGILDAITSYASFKSRKIGKEGRKTKNVRGIPKLDDANRAGTRESHKCVLILTEGDSAKTLAVSGLSIVGRDYYGVFPLKGKPLNVREAKYTQVANNDEIQNIVKIMGLKRDVEYTEETVKKLRYGSIMIMADQDHDGSHIKGLLINFLHWYNKSLLLIPGFLREFITPIVKATKGKKECKIFYTLPEYESWIESLDENEETIAKELKKWKIKYYKGLGTSTAKEAKEYFGNLQQNMLNFAWEESDEECIKLAFASQKRDARKTWISGVTKETFLDHKVCSDRGYVRYDEFFNKEFVLFSKASVLRAIPNVVDGFKPSQRKVLFSCFKRKLHSEIKVAQLAGYVSEHGAYHHGEASLMSTIVGMAQNFVGSNNINLLYPSGQFGTRLLGGNDSASPRYIFTKLAKITRAIFPEADDPVLEYLYEEGQKIEPEFYCPVIPMALVNGCSGIATGWSTEVPMFNPKDIIENVRRCIRGEEMKSMTPWCRGFTGNVVECEKKRGVFETFGVAELLEHPLGDEGDEPGNLKILIKELPIGTWTQKYKEFLESMLVSNASSSSASSKDKKKTTKKKAPSCLLDFDCNYTDTTVSFELTFKDGIHFDIKKEDGPSAPMKSQKFIKAMKLSSKLNMTNMMLITPTNTSLVTKFPTPVSLIQDFFKIRLETYKKRKAYIMNELRADFTKLSNQAKFILEFVEGKLIISRRKESEIAKDLVSRGYKRIFKKKKKDEGAQEEEEHEDTSLEGYDYLVSMNIRSLTLEKVESLRQKLMTKKTELEKLEKTSPEDLWETDLVEFEKCLQEFEDMLQNDRDDEETARLKQQGKSKKKKKKRVVKKKKKKTVEQPAVVVPVIPQPVVEEKKEEEEDIPLAMRMMSRLKVTKKTDVSIAETMKKAPAPIKRKLSATKKVSNDSTIAKPEIPTRSVLVKLKVSELKGLLRQHGLPLKGKKSELVDRLLGGDSNPSSPIKKKANVVVQKKKKEEEADVVVIDEDSEDEDDAFEKEPTPKPRRKRLKPKVNYATYFDDEEEEEKVAEEKDGDEEDAWSEDDFVPEEEDDDDSDWE